MSNEPSWTARAFMLGVAALITLLLILHAVSWVALITRLFFANYTFLRDLLTLLGAAVVFVFFGFVAVLFTFGLAGAGASRGALGLNAAVMGIERDEDDDEDNSFKGAYAVVVVAAALAFSAPIAGWFFVSRPSAPAFGAPLARNLNRFQNFTADTRPSLGLALSGGGYRAALFHAGVLAGLETMPVQTTHITTVSGGSIIGAFYATGGSPRDFAEAVQQGRLNVKINLFNMQTPLRLPGDFTRTDLQRELLDGLLLRGVQLKELGERPAPSIMFAATDLITGEAVGVAGDGILYRPLPTLQVASLEVQWPPSQFVPTDGLGIPGSLNVAGIVAASGAFPGAFAPVDLTHNGRHLSLSDGGILDNLGVELMIDRYVRSWGAVPKSESWAFDALLVSDAGAPFEPRREGDGLFGNLTRFVDLIYARSGASRPVSEAEALNIRRLSPDQLQGSDGKGPSDAEVQHLASARGAPVEVVRRELEEGLRAFASTPTLADYVPDNAEPLFRLGQYLVWLNQPFFNSIRVVQPVEPRR